MNKFVNYKLQLKLLLLVSILWLPGCSDKGDPAITTDSEILSQVSNIEKGLVGRWEFDESSGDSALDSSGYSNTAHILNGERSVGKHGNALLMDGGDNSIVTIPLSKSLMSTVHNVTLMAWTYRTAVHNVDIVGHTYPYMFFGYHGPQFKFQLSNQKGKKAKCYANKKYKAEVNEWYHLAGTYDGKEIRLFVNGKEICSAPMTGLIAMPGEPFTISGYRNKKNKIIDEITGMIDDVRIYNRALTNDEIVKAMNAAE